MLKRSKNILHLFDAAVEAEKKFDFTIAKKHYSRIASQYPDSPEAEIARDRINDMDALANEKRVYRRIDRNARRVLTEIGVDISNNPELLDILIQADAVDFDNDRALFIPVQEDYLDYCLDMAPKDLDADPGENAFGTGATPPFLLRPGRDDLAPANRAEFEQIVDKACEFTDSLGIFSIPVATDKSVSDYECAQIMNRFPELKMTHTRNMTDEEAAFLRDRPDWLDGTSLMASLTFMPSMVEPFLRSVRLGNNLLLLDLTIAGATGPASPEALLTQVHAHVLFMIMLAQTINPGLTCVHGGIPDVLGVGGDLSYSDPGQPIINSAMARLNMWVTGLPSAQSGGSTSILDDIEAAVEESELSRNTLRQYGAHIIRHAMGALGSLNYFSLEKFVEDCKRERMSRRIWLKQRHDLILPLYFPEDKEALAGIREIAEKWGPKNADHTRRNVGAFRKWHQRLVEASQEKEYYPDLLDTVKRDKEKFERVPVEETSLQLQDSFFLDGDWDVNE